MNRFLLRTGAVGVFALGIQVALPAYAEEPSSHDFSGRTLEAYLDRALEANPGLQAFRNRYRAAREQVPQASALPDPMIQATHFIESIETRNGPQENAVMLNQKLPWFGKLRNRERAATAEAEALGHALRNRQLELIEQVGTGFFEYGYIERAVNLTRENLDLLKELEPTVEARVQTGGDLNALLRLKVEIGKLNDRLQSLRETRTTRSALLRRELALAGDEPLPWPEWEIPDRVEPDPRALLDGMLSSHPELRMLERKLDSAAARRELARLESYPDITLGVQYNQIGDPSGAMSAADAGQDAWGVTAALNLPIWAGKNRAARNEAREREQAVEQEVEDRRHALRSELATALSKLEDAQRRLDLYGTELLGLARQAVENSRASYEGGRTGLLEVIDSERTLLDLQLLHSRAAADAWKQRIILQTLTHDPLGVDSDLPSIPPAAP